MTSYLKILCFAWVLFAFLAPPVDARAQAKGHVEGEIIVMLHKGVAADEFLRLPEIASINPPVEYVRTLSTLSNIHLFRFDQNQLEENEILRIIRDAKPIREAQFNHFVQERALPNDPLLGNQWHHSKMESQDAWDITTGGTTAGGDEIVVCVIEGGGANYNHPDLIGNHWTNQNEIAGNGIDDDGNGFVDDYNGWNAVGLNDNVGSGGHGTSVSGMIGAKGNNGIGGVGVNWNVKIMQVRVGSLNEANVIAAYNYPHQMRTLYNNTGGQSGAFVVATNASWGIDYGKPSNYPVWCAYYEDLGEAGILNCGATSNSNLNVDAVGDMPTACASDYMVSVTATNSNDQRTFSAYGATTIDLAAPGASVYLTSGSSGYSSATGTSFASPAVAGAIALVYSAPCANLASLALSDPQSAADLVRGYILDGVDPVPSLAGFTVTGGRLNLKNALDLALADCGPDPVCEPVSLSAQAQCAYDADSDAVVSEILLSAVLSSDFCGADTLCFASDESGTTCLVLSEEIQSLSNSEDYVLTGLNDQTEYSIWYFANDIQSEVVVVSTGACGLEIPGCTDPDALNFNPSATFDTGQCTYPCTSVSLSLDTDCWGAEVSWEIRDNNGDLVASAVPGTYGNQMNYSWDDCLPGGCYTFTIFDTFGDGMNGSIYGQCQVDGNYTLSGDGTTLVQMGHPNYGYSQTHSFCVGDPVVECENPYPTVGGLYTEYAPNGVYFGWNPIPGSIGCQVQGSLAGGGGTKTFTVSNFEAAGVFVSQSNLNLGQEYRWRVRCGCSTQPLIVGPWSEYAYFDWPQAGADFELRGENPGMHVDDLVLTPNPASQILNVYFHAKDAGRASFEVIDLTGSVRFASDFSYELGENLFRFNPTQLPAGFYFVRLKDASGIRTGKFLKE